MNIGRSEFVAMKNKIVELKKELNEMKNNTAMSKLWLCKLEFLEALDWYEECLEFTKQLNSWSDTFKSASIIERNAYKEYQNMCSKALKIFRESNN